MLTLEQKIGQMVMVGFPGLEPPAYILDWLREGRIGGVILFARNVESPAQLAALTAACHQAAANQPPILISIDQEGGIVARLRESAGFTESPGAMALSASGSEQLAEEMSAALASELRALGINWNYAPAVDITHDIDNASIGTRSPGADPAWVSKIAAAQIRGFRRGGAASTAKHFPGIGNTPIDTHLALAVVSGSVEFLWKQDLVPFRAAVQAGVDAVMVGHVKFEALDPEHPSTLSPAVVTGLLRREMGFTGVACTDCMEMKAVSNHYGAGESAVLAALAGIDIVLFSHTRAMQEAAYDALLEAAHSGRLPMARIDEANARIAALKAKHAVTTPRDLSAIRRPEHLELAARAARAGVVLLKGGDLLPLDLSDPGVGVIEFAGYLDDEALARGGDSTFGALLRARGAACASLRQGELGSPHPTTPSTSGKGGAESTSVAGASEERQASDLHAVLSPQSSSLHQAYALAERCDTLVLCTRSAHLNPDQLATARDLLDRAKRVIVVALRNPYDAAALPEADAILCTCGDSRPSLVAALDALSGAFQPSGRLPVTIQTTGRETKWAKS